MSYRHLALGQLNRLAIFSFAALFTVALSACGGGGGGGGNGSGPVASTTPITLPGEGVKVPDPNPGPTDVAPDPMDPPVTVTEKPDVPEEKPEPVVKPVLPTEESEPAEESGSTGATDRVVKTWRSCDYPYRVFGYASIANCLPQVTESANYNNRDLKRNSEMLVDKLFVVDDNFKEGTELSHGETIIRLIHYFRQDRISIEFFELPTLSSKTVYASTALNFYKQIPAGSLVNLSHDGFFDSAGELSKEDVVDALKNGAHLLKSAGNEGVEGPGLGTRLSKEVVDAVSNSEEANKKMFWVSGIGFRGEKKIFNACKGVEDYCISVNEVVHLRDEISSSLYFFQGTSASSALAFALFSVAWERLPVGSDISLVYSLAKECTPAGKIGSMESPTPEYGLGRLSFSCLLEKASGRGDESLSGEPFVYDLFGDKLGEVILPGSSDVGFQVEYGDVVEDYSLTRGLTSSYIPNSLETEHSLPLTKHVSLSLRENEEFGVTFGLPLSSRISFSTRETPTFFGGSGTKAFAFSKTKNVRTYFEVDVFQKTSFGVWKTDARAEGEGHLIDHVQGKEVGLTFRSRFQPGKNTNLLLYGSASRFEGGTLRTLSKDHRINRGPIHREVGLSVYHRF